MSPQSPREVLRPETASPPSAMRRADGAPTGYLRAVLGPVVVVYGLSRILSSALLALGYEIARLHPAVVGGTRAPNVLAYLTRWDAAYYQSIATSGYPSHLPHDASGHVMPNDWAFLPVFPGVSRFVGGLLHLPFGAAGTGVALLAGFAACLALFHLCEPHVGRTRALRATALFALAPMAFLLQVPYAEGLFVALSLVAMIGLERRRYLLFAAAATVAAFTRPGAIALPAALVALVLVRLRRQDRPKASEWIRIAAALAVSLVASVAWPVVASAATGTSSAYLLSETAWWRRPGVTPSFVPFEPWLLQGSRYLGAAGIVGAVVAVALLLVVTWLLCRPAGAASRSFVIMYVLYLFAVFLPQQSILRVLLPTAPAAASGLFTQTRRRFAAWAVAASLAQAACVLVLWVHWSP